MTERWMYVAKDQLLFEVRCDCGAMWSSYGLSDWASEQLRLHREARPKCQPTGINPRVLVF